MGFFRRGSKKKGKGGGDSSDSTPADSVDDEPQSTGHETAPPSASALFPGCSQRTSMGRRHSSAMWSRSVSGPKMKTTIVNCRRSTLPGVNSEMMKRKPRLE